MRIVVGSDRSGFAMKQKLTPFLESMGHTLVDVGIFAESEQYPFPILAQLATRKILDGEVDRAILSGGSGIGLLVAANKVPGIRAAFIHDVLAAREAVEDFDVQVMCYGGKVAGEGIIRACAEAFLDARFKGDAAAQARVDRIGTLDP